MAQREDRHATVAGSSSDPGEPQLTLHPLPEPSPSAAARRVLALETLTVSFIALIHAACWIVAMLDVTSSAIYHIGAGLQLVALTSLLAAMLVTPATFLRARVLLLLAVKLALYLPSSSRGLAGVPQVLRHAASPGVRGTMVDASRLFVGEHGDREDGAMQHCRHTRLFDCHQQHSLPTLQTLVARHTLRLYLGQWHSVPAAAGLAAAVPGRAHSLDPGRLLRDRPAA